MNPWTDRHTVRMSAVVASAVLLGVAVAASFSFGHQLARLAGASPVQAWLWPITVGATVFEVFYGYVMVGILPYRLPVTRSWFALQMFAAVFTSIWGNAFLATKPGDLADTSSAALGIVPPVCLLLVAVNTVMFLNAMDPRGLDINPRPALRLASEETNSVEA